MHSMTMRQESWREKYRNNRFLPFIYELDDREEWDKEECWEKANPGLGPIKSYDYLRQMVQKAKADPTFKPTVLVKDFNLKQTAETAWLRWKILIMKSELEIKNFVMELAGLMQLIVWI